MPGKASAIASISPNQQIFLFEPHRDDSEEELLAQLDAILDHPALFGLGMSGLPLSKKIPQKINSSSPILRRLLLLSFCNTWITKELLESLSLVMNSESHITGFSLTQCHSLDLQMSSQLTIALSRAPFLTEVDFTQTFIGDSNLEQLLGMLTTHSPLTSLTLRNSGVGQRTLLFLQKWIPTSNPPLEVLNLADNAALVESMVIAFVRALPKMQLLTLDLSGLELTNDTLKAVSKALHTTKQLIKLDLPSNFAWKDTSYLTQLLNRNRNEWDKIFTQSFRNVASLLKKQNWQRAAMTLIRLRSRLFRHLSTALTSDQRKRAFAFRSKWSFCALQLYLDHCLKQQQQFTRPLPPMINAAIAVFKSIDPKSQQFTASLNLFCDLLDVDENMLMVQPEVQTQFRATKLQFMKRSLRYRPQALKTLFEIMQSEQCSLEGKSHEQLFEEAQSLAGEMLFPFPTYEPVGDHEHTHMLSEIQTMRALFRVPAASSSPISATSSSSTSRHDRATADDDDGDPPLINNTSSSATVHTVDDDGDPQLISNTNSSRTIHSVASRSDDDDGDPQPISAERNELQLSDSQSPRSNFRVISVEQLDRMTESFKAAQARRALRGSDHDSSDTDIDKDETPQATRELRKLSSIRRSEIETMHLLLEESRNRQHRRATLNGNSTEVIQALITFRRRVSNRPTRFFYPSIDIEAFAALIEFIDNPSAPAPALNQIAILQSNTDLANFLKRGGARLLVNTSATTVATLVEQLRSLRDSELQSVQTLSASPEHE